MRYRENPKHKKGCSGEGPPRWFPSRDSLCPDDVSLSEAESLLESSLPGRDDAHPQAQSRFAMDGQGRFFKGYSEDGGRTWHGYPVRREQVRRQIPARVLKQFVEKGLLSRAEFKKLLGSAS